MKTYRKDPDSKLDYQINWSDFLGDTDYITASTWIIESGITKVTDTFTTNNTTVWLDGGTIDETYVIINRINTNDGREADRSFAIHISEWQGIATLAEVAIISGKSSSSIDCTWLSLADEYVKLILNRDFSETADCSQYEDTVNNNDFYSNYDGNRKFVLLNVPVTEITSVIYLPDSDDPETLTLNEDYYVDLGKGIVELDEDFDPVIGQRTFKIEYKYGYDETPAAVTAFANLYAAFLLESNLAKNDDGVILAEVEIGRYREKYANASTALKAKYSKLEEMEKLLINKYKLWD